MERSQGGASLHALKNLRVVPQKPLGWFELLALPRLEKVSLKRGLEALSSLEKECFQSSLWAPPRWGTVS